MPNQSPLEAKITQLLRSIARFWTLSLKDVQFLPSMGNLLNLTFNFDLATGHKQRCLRSIRFHEGRWRLFGGLHPGSGGNGIVTIRGTLIDVLGALDGTGPNLIALLQDGRVLVPDARNSTQNIYLLAALCEPFVRELNSPKVIPRD